MSKYVLGALEFEPLHRGRTVVKHLALWGRGSRFLLMRQAGGYLGPPKIGRPEVAGRMCCPNPITGCNAGNIQSSLLRRKTLDQRRAPAGPIAAGEQGLVLDYCPSLIR